MSSIIVILLLLLLFYLSSYVILNNTIPSKKSSCSSSQPVYWFAAVSVDVAFTIICCMFCNRGLPLHPFPITMPSDIIVIRPSKFVQLVTFFCIVYLSLNCLILEDFLVCNSASPTILCSTPFCHY